MGFKILNESVIPIGVIKSLLSDFAQSVGKNLDNITKVTNQVSKNKSIVDLYNSLKNSTDESVKNFISSVDEVAQISKKNTTDLLDEITTGKVDPNIEEDILSKIISKQTGFDVNLYRVLEKEGLNTEAKELYKSVSTVYSGRDIESMKNAFANNPEALKRANELNQQIRSRIMALPDGSFKKELQKNWDGQIKYFNETFVNKDIKIESTIFDKLKNNPKLAANKEIIGQKFKDMFYSVIETKGELWWSKNKSELVVSITDDAGNVKNLTREEAYKLILDQVNNKTRGQKLYATNPSSKSKITPEEFLKNLENYKTIGDGNLNYLDTHNTEFLNILKKFIDDEMPNPEQTMKKIEEELQKGVYSEVDNVINNMKENSDFWGNIIKNSDQYSKEIQNTVRVGNEAEELIKNKIDTLFPGYKLFYKGGVGDAIDKFVGIDVVIYRMNSSGEVELKFLQVKNAQKMSFLGDIGSKETFLKIFNKNKVRISKPSQLDFVCYVKGDTIAVIKKDNLYEWDNEIQSLVKTEKSGFQSQNPYGYTEQNLNSVYAFVDDTGEQVVVYKEN